LANRRGGALSHGNRPGAVQLPGRELIAHAAVGRERLGPIAAVFGDLGPNEAVIEKRRRALFRREIVFRKQPVKGRQVLGRRQRSQERRLIVGSYESEMVDACYAGEMSELLDDPLLGHGKEPKTS
jgi:hypothetical protein